MARGVPLAASNGGWPSPNDLFPAIECLAIGAYFLTDEGATRRPNSRELDMRESGDDEVRRKIKAKLLI